MKKIIVVSLIKNEEQIIECFIRHCLTFSDQVLIINHGSTDATTTILSQLINEGLPVLVFDEHDPAYRQARFTLRAIKLAFNTYKADFVLPLDADEFLESNVIEMPIREQIMRLDAQLYYKVLWRTYLPTQDDAQFDFKNFQRIRRPTYEQYTKLIIPRPFFKKYRARPLMGNHEVLTLRLFKKPEAVLLQDLSLAHFPIRNKNQLLFKLIIGYAALVAENRALPGGHWKELTDRILEKADLSIEELQIHAIDYATGKSVLDSDDNTYSKIIDQNSLGHIFNAESPIITKYSGFIKQKSYISKIADELIAIYLKTAKAVPRRNISEWLSHYLKY